MKRLLFMVIAVMLALSVLRVLNNGEPLTLHSMLNALTDLDIDFSNTIDNIVELRDDLNFPSMGGNIFTKTAKFFKWLYKLFTGVFSIPFTILGDLLDFIASVFNFFAFLVGIR